ncbi:hypothetical protein GCM10010277_23710 [Streptomyces longisporoflavus]|uniref:hypothetical protein n=1 Tax=Streptomyces longisporoflavus TaxID=28044 RepID=UPI00167E0F7D|nr:hypothetical protein [Streptomyces longisporoflavus]GGV37277.1 hypothetical protein GCM10010277_23710 [Streptomyces longisporoflavus]
MRKARLLTTAALAVASASLLAPSTAVAAAADAAGGGLEVRPGTVMPGSSVTVSTTACGSEGAASGDASAVGAGTFTLTPGAQKEKAAGEFEVPPSAQPGTYEIVAKCSGAGADGKELAGDLIVTITSTAAAREEQPVAPKGYVKTGVGGALGPDPVQTAAGVAALAVAAAGGTWLLHRRARGDRI